MDTLELLEQKISKALNVVEKLTTENKTLKEENQQLSTELDKLKADLNSAETEKNEQADRIKGRLGSILERLDQLEEVGA
jgi:regulator of replication initiation timing